MGMSGMRWLFVGASVLLAGVLAAVPTWGDDAPAANVSPVSAKTDAPSAAAPPAPAPEQGNPPGDAAPKVPDVDWPKPSADAGAKPAEDATLSADGDKARTPAASEKPTSTEEHADSENRVEEKPAEPDSEKPQTSAESENPAVAQEPAERAKETSAEASAAQPAKPAETPAKPAEVRFQFDGIPYDDVIRRFAQMRNKPILGDYHVEGTLTFFDPKPYSPEEAFDTLNLLLAMRGFMAVETDRYLRIVPIKEATKSPLPIVKGWDEADDMRPGEIITLMLPLKVMSAADAVRVLAPVVSSFGSVAPLGTGRGIIITDRVSNLKRIKSVLDELDTGVLSSDAVVKTYRLEHAPAADVAKVISDLFGTSSQSSNLKYIRDEHGRMVRNPNYKETPPSERLTTTSDARTNTLFLAGPGEKIAMVEPVIEQLDEVSPQEAGAIRVFDLQNARAENLANTIEQLLASRRYSDRYSRSRSSGQVETRVVADKITNRLIVTAPMDQMARIADLITKLDMGSTEVGGMKVFRLKVADARQVAEVIANALRSPSRYGSDGHERSSMATAVSADSRTNSLIVTGSQADIQTVERLVEELDRPMEEAAREVHVVQLKVGDADDMADALNRMFSRPDRYGRRTEGTVHVAAEDNTNTLFITATPGDWPTVQKILDQVKASVETATAPATRVIKLQNALPSEVAKAVNQMYQYRWHIMRDRRGRPAATPVVVSPSDRTKSLIVSASAEDLDAIGKLVQSLDVPTETDAEPVHILRLESGDAVRIADTLRSMQEHSSQDVGRRVFIQGDAGSNTILVRAPKEEFEAIQALVKELDQTITTTGGLKAFRLKVADAQQLAGVVRSALAQGRPYVRGEQSPMVTADARTNSLIVSGTASDIQTTQRLVEELDKETDVEAREIHVVQLQTGDARQLAAALMRMLSQTDAYGRPTGTNVRVEADTGTNSLLISAAPGEWPTIDKLLTELKASAVPMTTASTRLIPLEHADAEELANTLRQVFPSSRSSMYRSYGRHEIGGLTEVPVVIAANKQTNSLVISAAEDDQQAIAQLITSMDVPEAEGVAPMQIIRLTSADAAELADTLREMVPEAARGERSTVQIQASPGANAVLLRAPESERKRIEEMIANLDQATQDQAREVRVIQLKHASAAKLSDLLEQMYGSGSSRSYVDYRSRSSRPSSAADRVVVAATPSDHALLVEAPRSKMKEIADLVASMDVEPGPSPVEVRTYRLTDAQAPNVAQALARLMSEKVKAANQSGGTEPKPTFEADSATNQLLVAATADQFTTIEELIKKLEAGTQVTRETKTFRLKTAKAEEVVRILDTMLNTGVSSDSRERYRTPARPPEVRVAAVAETNDVVVQGAPEKIAMAAQLIETLDKEAAADKTSIVIVPLKNAQAASLADAVNEAISARTAVSRYSRQEPETRRESVTVTAELNSNSILVRGPAEDIPEVVEMIRNLDSESTGTGAEVRVYPLENGEPSELAPSLEKLFRDILSQQASRQGRGPQIPFSIAADDRTRSLVVSTTPAQFAMVEQVLNSLDQEPAAVASDVQYIWLENADAYEVAQQLTDLYADRKGEKPLITPDVFSNALTVIAKSEDLNEIIPIVQKLDDAAKDNSYRVRVIPLLDVKAQKMAEILKSVYKQMTGRDLQVAAEPPSDAERNDQGLLPPPAPPKTPAAAPASTPSPMPPGPTGEPGATGATETPPVEVAVPNPHDKPASRVPVEKPDDKTPDGEAAEEKPSDAVQAILDKLGADQEAAEVEEEESPPPTVAIDPVTNSLIVSGKRQDIDYIENLISELSLSAMDLEAEFRVFPIEKADPESVARTLDELFNPKPKQRQPQRGGGQAQAPAAPEPPPSISVVSDPRTRCVIVRAKPNDFEDVERLIKVLDQIPTVVSEVRMFHLKNTSAVEVAANLTDLFTRAVRQQQQPQPQQPPQRGGDPRQKQSSQRQSPQQQRVEMVRQVLELKTPDGVTQVDLVNMVNVTANAQTNSVIVTAPVDAMAVVAGIIEELDQSGQSVVPSVRMYPIANGEIQPMVSELRDLFADERRTAGRTSSAGPQKEITITGDEAGRLIIVSAPSDEQDRIAEVIKEMDEAQAAGEVKVVVYHIKNADAGEVASALLATVGRSGTTASSGMGGRSRGGQAGRIAISADRSGNTILVRAPAEEHARISQLISEMDQAPEALIRTYPIKNARVATVVQAVKDVFATRAAGSMGRPQRAEANAVVVTGDEAGRLVIVSAPEEKHTLVAKVIEEIDNAQGDDQVAVKVYRLRNAEASQVASALQVTLDQAATGVARGGYGRTFGASAAGGQVRISADTSSNSLVVRASPDDHERIAQLIEELDVAPTEEYAVRLIPLKNADPEAVEDILDNAFEQRSSSRNSRYGGMTTPSRRPVIIEGNKEAHMLAVRADDKTFEKIKALAEELDQATVGTDLAPTLITLKYAQAASVADAIRQSFATSSRNNGRTSDTESVTVVAEPGSNSVIVTANAENLAKVQALIDKLDAADIGGVRSEMLILEHAKAEDLAPVLQQMARSSASSARGGRTGAGSQQGISVAADKGSNALVITGPSADMDRILAMAKNLDQATTAAASSVRVIQLTNGDAAEVAAMVEDLYRQQWQQARMAGQSIEPLAVSADARANALVLATNEQMYQQVAQWVQQIESMQPSRGKLRLITLKNADPAEVEAAIRQIFGDGATTGGTLIRRSGGSSSSYRRSGGGSSSSRPRAPRGAPGETGSTGPGGRVETTVLDQQRSILVNASDEDFEAIKALAEALDAAAADARRQFKVFALKNTSNTKIATALAALYRQAAAGKAEEQVTVTALPDTNALVVSATAARMDEVTHLIEQLDKEEIAPQLEFRIYALENAQPTKVLPVLQKMLAQVQKTRPGEPIDVQADERTRSVIVTTRGALFDQVEKIIKTLDQKPAFAETEVLVIPLKKADATRLAEVLTEMLRPSPQDQITPEARALQEQVRLLRVRGVPGEQIPELDLTKPIKIVADPTQFNAQGSNALVITSTPDNLKALEALVGLLDVVPLAEGVRVRVVHLTNADAESVTAILQDIFEQGERLAGKPKSSVEGRAEPESAAGKALTNPLNVSADLRTNSIVMSGLEESLALAEVLIADLDRDAGKIITDVRLFRLKHASAERIAPMLTSVFGEGNATAGTEGLKTQVTRLRTILKDELGHVTEVPKTREALAIEADPTTNILVVAARSDVMPLIADVISTMDVPGAGSMTAVQIFPLQNADATRLKDIVDNLYSGPNARFVRPEDVPTVGVDTRTNALVVSASENTFAVLQALVRRLDAEQPIEMREIRIVPLKNAEATSLADVVQQMMDARVERYETLGAADAEALRVIIVADERSNSLIVGGSAEGFKLVDSLAKQLDGASPAISGQIQILPLEHANAGTLSATLQNLFDERYQAARTEDVRRQQPVILPDLRVNALLVAANADDSAIIKELLTKLDVEPKDPAVQLTVLPLKHNDAGVVGPIIDRLFQARLQSMTPQGQQPQPQDRVDIEAESLSNSLIVSASKDNMALIRGLLEKVDVEPPDETGIVRIFPLKNSDAQRVGTMLQSLISQGFYKPGVLMAGDSELVQAREKVAIEVDTRTNVLIVSASKENFAVLEEIIHKIDSSEDYSVLGDIRLFTLKNASADRLAPTLQQLFDAKRQAEIAAGSSGRMLPVSIIPDGRTNTLLVAGSRESMNALEAMIKQLDAGEVLAANEFRIFYLKNATAAVLQPTLEQLFAQRATRGEPAEAVTIVPELRTNALLVSASPDDMRLAESLINRLDSEPDRPGNTVTVFPLKKADATQVAETLRTLYAAPGRAAGQTTAGISVDERINAIVVSAGTTDLKRIEELVKQLDTDSLPRVTEIRVFTLDNADATELAQILNDALNQKPEALTQTSPNRQTLLQFITHTKDGGEIVATALQEGVLIVPDRRTNSLVISAPSENMPLLESLVRAMDDAQPRTAEIRVFTLVNSDAQAMAQVLTELFRLQESATSKQSVEYVLVPPQAEGAGDAGGSEGGARIGSAQDVALTVTVDVRTNSLLVGGTRHYVDLASKVIRELDQSTAAERLTEVYRLRNAQAENIETAVTNFLQQERDVLEESLGGSAGGTLPFILEREVAIVAEPETNTLLLSASPRYYNVIADMIQELDQPPPQVLIQVLLADVTIDETNEFGVEWNVHEALRHSHDLVGGTAPGFAASAGLTLNQGFTVSVTGGDVNFLLRAIEAQGRVEILSRPQVLAADNQEATINVGQRVPFITNSRITEDGTTINTIQYEEVGVILRVTPRINPDGLVRLEVHPEISSIDESSVPISEGVNAIVINNRSADTTVTVQDGHTIVVGGLIRTTDRDRVDKVPVLGDIPLLGELFKSTRKVRERSELLIILTPTVLQTIEDADTTTASETRRLNLLRASHDGGVKEENLNEYGEQLIQEFGIGDEPKQPADVEMPTEPKDKNQASPRPGTPDTPQTRTDADPKAKTPAASKTLVPAKPRGDRPTSDPTEPDVGATAFKVAVPAHRDAETP